tara:strand:+ start:254 stop:1390 length:1137 start_codon:yes stop_codon:yes gene_type:complete
MRIPFAKPNLDKIDLSGIKETLNSGILVHGKKTIMFEKKFSNLVKSNFALSTSSCTTSLYMAALSLNLKKRDEVLVSAQTHVATVHAIEAVGAKPVFVDSSEVDGNISLKDLEKKITKKTKAIFIVHYLGRPQPMKEILSFTKKYNLRLVEDCALALGAKYDGQSVGTFGDFGCFSFHPVKLMTTGEGGFITIKNKKDFITLKDIRSFGVRKNFYERKIPGYYDVENFGLNFRMGEINSSLGITQLNKLPYMLKKRETNYKLLKKKIIGNKNFRILKTESSKKFKSSYYCMNIILNNNLLKKRNQIIKKLNNSGVGTSIYYPLPVPHFSYYKKKYNVSIKNYSTALLLSNASISLPVGPHISKKGIEFIARIVNNLIT